MSESNDEVKLIEERVKLFKLKANEIQYQFTSKDLYKTLGQIEAIIQNLDTTQCSELLLVEFLQKSMEEFVNKISIRFYIDEDKKHLNMRAVQVVIAKLIFVFAVNKQYQLAIRPLKKILTKKDNFLFFQEQKSSPSKMFNFAAASRDDSEIGIQQFYVKCVEFVREEFTKLVKEVWNMSLQALTDLIDLFITLQKQKQKRTYMTTVLDLYFTQFMAFLQSGRPQLVDFANYEQLSILSRNFSNSVQKIIKKQQIEKIIPSLAKTLIQKDKVSRRAGIRLLSGLWKKVVDYSFNNSQEEQSRESLFKISIYQLLLNENFCQQQEQDVNTIVKFMDRGYHQKYKIQPSFILQKLKEDKHENKFYAKFCYKLLNVYALSTQQKNTFVTYLQELPNVVDSYPLITQPIDDLLYRYSSSDPYNERLFRLIERIMRGAYMSLNLSSQKRLLQHFKKSARGLKTILRFMSSNDQKITYLKVYAKDLLEQISFTRIIIFNIVFEESEVNGCFGNNQFQSIINYVVEELNLFSKIFQYIDQNTKVSQYYRDIVKLIRFTTNKCTIKVDITEKYIKTLAKFPELYQLLIENEGYQKIHTQMEKVIDLFRTDPTTPFHILRTTFLKANYKSFTQYKKKVNILSNKGEQGTLRNEPTQLQFYEQLIILLEQTNNSQFRQQLAQFIVILHLNYESVNKQDLIKYMASILDYFNENTKSFYDKMATKSSVLSNIELIKQMIQMTDILGVGKLKPHNSLVSTSTIYLTINNNATFGDDVQKSVSRNFSTNMILFDLLAIVSVSFRCGPEDLVLRQGSRFISIIYNGKTLQDLNFTSQEIIAQKNEINQTESPDLFKKDMGSKEVVITEVFNKCFTQIFNRFSFEGKMGQIECMNYLKQVSDSYISIHDRKLKEMMQDFDKDNDGILTLSDFLAYNIKKLTSFTGSYYQEQFKKGLYNLRYRKNLTLPEEPLSISDRYYLMMRFKIEKSPQIYEKLFVYTENEDEEISQKAKQLLMYLPTSNSLRSNIKEIFNFDSNSEFLIYYKLILIESQLSQNHQNVCIQEYKKQKTAKIHEFIDNHYNEIIFDQLKKFYQNINQSAFAYKCFTICLKILRSLINIDNLIQTNISSLKFSEDLIHLLPNTNFFSKEAIRALAAKNTINFEVLLVLQLTQSEAQIGPIIAGCFNDDQQIRKTCCNFLYLWQEKVQWKDNLFEVQIVDERFIQWFELLCIIIERTSKYDLQKILIHTISILEKREETLFNRYDKLMHGYLKILKSIVKKHTSIIDSSKFHKIIQRLLVKAISEKNRSLLYEIMIELNDQILMDYLDNMLSTVKPSQQCQIKTKYVGIKNLGAICYINSIIQQFFMISKFRYLILNRQIPKDCQEKLVNNKMVVDNFMFQLQKMYENLQTSQKKYYVPSEFCYSYKDWQGKPINTSIQQDSHQFLNRLIENVEQACKKDGNLESLQKIFEIKTLTQFECGQCKNRIDKIETHYNCMLQVKQQQSLASSLKKFTQKQQIQGYTCENCKKKVKQISKRTYFHEMPEIVILNMQRIIYDQMKGDKIKVHSKLTFPMEINFEQFMKHQNIEKMETKYRLKGVVIHTGTSEGGHYYSLIRDNNSEGWLKFNDQNVVPFDEKEIAREGFGGFQSKDNHFQQITYSTNAYILFYQSTANKNKDFIQVENNLSIKVQQENQILIKEIQAHQECFFVAINNLYQKHRLKTTEVMMADVQTQNTLKSKKAVSLKFLDIYIKALTFLQVYTSIKNQIKSKMFSNMLQLYEIQKQQSLKFIENIQFDQFWDQMILLKDQFTREISYQLFKTNLFAYLRQKKVKMTNDTQETQKVKLFIDFTIQMLNSFTFYSNLSKAGVLLQFILELIDFSEDIKFYFLRHHLMFKLLDLIMGRQSSYMKYHSKAQDIPKDLVSIIFNILGKLMIFKKNIKGHRFNKQDLENEFETTTLEVKILMNPAFYRRIFRLNYNHEVLGSLIFQYSLSDLDYTLMIGDILLTQLNKLDQGEVALLFKQIQIFLSINDDLQELRYSFILGIPQYISTGGSLNQFCLGLSDKSQTVTYVSGAYLNKDDWLKMQNDKRPLLQLIFCEKGQRNSSALAAFYGLQLLVILAEGSEKAFRYLIGIPPPNYLKLHIFDLIPEISARLIDNQNFIIEGKLLKLTQINQLFSMIQERLKVMDKQFPVQKYIIGKTKSTDEVSKLDHQYYIFILRRCLTYVLQNVPLGTENKSMNNTFKYQNKGIANFFLEYRSNLSNWEQKLQVKPTVFMLKGKAKHKLLLRFKNQRFNYMALLNDDEFNINMPYYQDGQILDFVQIQLYKEPQLQISQDQLKEVFAKIMEQQKKREDDPAKPIMMDEEKATMEQGKIACPICTYMNDITKQRCDICQNFLFQ